MAHDDDAVNHLALDLVELLSEPGRFDFDAAEHAWGGDHHVVASDAVQAIDPILEQGNTN